MCSDLPRKNARVICLPELHYAAVLENGEATD